MQVYSGAATVISELAIEGLDASQELIGSVPFCRVVGEPDPPGCEHRVGRDFLGGIEILRHQRGRHPLGAPYVRESFARRAIDGKLAGRVQRLHPGQVANRVIVFSIVQPPQYERTGITRPRFRFGSEISTHPCLQTTSLVIPWLLRTLRRHLPAVEHLANLQPGFR